MNTTLITEIKKRSEIYGDKPTLYSKNKDNIFEFVTYKKLYELASELGAGLLDIGVRRDDHIGVLSDNRKEWMIANIAILGIGAADVPRGCDSTKEEVTYILNHAECKISFIEDQIQLEKIFTIVEKLSILKIVIIMDSNFQKTTETAHGLTIYTFEEIINKGKTLLKSDSSLFEKELAKGNGEDIASIIYTSGTTGIPKGVMLTHNNFLHQTRAPLKFLYLSERDVVLSVLPIWHSFERVVEYLALFAGCSLVYSKPLAKVMLADMESMNPTIFPSVPRIWEAVRSAVYKKVNSEGGIKKGLFHFFIFIGASFAFFKNKFLGLLPKYKKPIRFFDILISIIPVILLTPLALLGNILVFKKIKHKLGKRFRFGISGAGGFPPHIDKFFQAIGVKIIEGYGLTEAAPVISARVERATVSNTMGKVLPEVEFKILDKSDNPVLPGQKGLLYVRGPNIMKGYYKQPEETKKILSDDGWLNTGDLVIATIDNHLKHMGRAKETIVLSGGKNIEPGPIEDVLLQSQYIQNALVLGQDQKYLCALIVPNFENVKTYAAQKGIPFNTEDDLIASTKIENLMSSEINNLISIKEGFQPHERIFKFKMIKKSFEPGLELTNSLKMRRKIISDIYKQEIDLLFK